MEQPLLYQMDMDGMAPWERFHLANVPEVPAPVRVKGIMEIRRSTHPTVLYQCGWGSMQVQQQYTPCFLHTEN